MFLGSDGGLLGVGAPEVVTILLVGYFVLGPSDLYKLTKEIGKGIQNFRTLSSDVTKTFENNMESQLQLEELRKAQRELNDAFSFRRSINVDEEAEAFATTPGSAAAENDDVRDATTSDSAAVSDAPKKKRKRKRVKKKKVEVPSVEEANGTATDSVSANVPDLEMPAPWDVDEPDEDERRRVEQELQLREDRMERLKTGTQSPLDEFGAPTIDFSESPAEEQERFAQQMSDSWNAQIMANSEELQPLAKVMERLAILEEEKKAADARLEEEFRLRTQLEEKFYREKREILEEAAAEVQAGAYTSLESTGNETNSKEQTARKEKTS
jgi:Sec-independent protein translocase protein TatA